MVSFIYVPLGRLRLIPFFPAVLIQCIAAVDDCKSDFLLFKLLIKADSHGFSICSCMYLSPVYQHLCSR